MYRTKRDNRLVKPEQLQNAALALLPSVIDGRIKQWARDEALGSPLANYQERESMVQEAYSLAELLYNVYEQRYQHTKNIKDGLK